MATVKISLKDIAQSKGRTSKDELDAMTDAQINRGALSDADSMVPTDEELGEFGEPKERGDDNEKEN